MQVSKLILVRMGMRPMSDGCSSVRQSHSYGYGFDCRSFIREESNYEIPLKERDKSWFLQGIQKDDKEITAKDKFIYLGFK